MASFTAADSREARGTLFKILTAAQGGRAFESSCDDCGEEGGKVEVDGVAGRLEQELAISEPEEVQLPEVAAGSGMQCEPGQCLPTGPCMRTTPDMVGEIALEQTAQSAIFGYQHSSAQLTQHTQSRSPTHSLNSGNCPEDTKTVTNDNRLLCKLLTRVKTRRRGSIFLATMEFNGVILEDHC